MRLWKDGRAQSGCCRHSCSELSFSAAFMMALPGVSGNMNTAYMGRVAANIQKILGHPELADLATARPLTIDQGSGKAGFCVEKSD